MGRFLGTSALAAVGATSVIVSLLVGFLQVWPVGPRWSLPNILAQEIVKKVSAGGTYGDPSGCVFRLGVYRTGNINGQGDPAYDEYTAGYYGRRDDLYSGSIIWDDPADAL